MIEREQDVKPFTIAAITIFGFVAIGHLLRLVFGWTVVVNGIQIPMWASVVGLVVPGGLVCMLWRESRS